MTEFHEQPQITYASEKYFRSYYETLANVAAEKIYIEMTEPPPFEKVVSFQNALISKNGPVYYALLNDQVVGWCDAFPSDNPRLAHRASLGMGLLPEFRGQGLGTKLLSTVVKHAKVTGLEKMELHVYTSNLAAIALYTKLGFEEEGVIRRYRKLDGQYFDSMIMGLFL
jgi:RimJ/RimL family protein N-acetyltransferase